MLCVSQLLVWAQSLCGPDRLVRSALAPLTCSQFLDPQPRGLHRRWHVHEDPHHSRRQSGASRLYVRSGACGDLCHDTPCCSCTDCQQGGLLELGSRWYPRPAARPAAVHFECRHPFGFLSEAVRTWTQLVKSSGASHIPAVHSGLPLSSWNSAGVPCWEPAPDIWRRHSMSSALCWLSHAGGTVHQTFNTQQWLWHVRGTACRRLSGMHRRWRRSVASWRLYFSGRHSTMIRRL